MIRRLIAILTVSLIGFGAVGRADHLPEKQQARGMPETSLAGIYLDGRTKLKDVIKSYGKPTSTKAWLNDNPNIYSSWDYYWVRPGLKLHLVVQGLRGKVSTTEYISLVEVDEGTSRRFGRTGKGLKIGDSLSDLKRTYGSRLQIRNFPNSRFRDVWIQWHREEYSLSVTLNERDRITSFSLVLPE